MNKIYDPELIAKRVRFVRTDIAKQNVRDFAEDVQTTPTNVRRWERGEHIPSAFCIFMICSEYAVSANWLLGLSDRR